MNFFNKMIFKGKQYSPEILIGFGIAGGVLALVAACKGTIKAQEILVPVNERVKDIKKYTPPEQQEEQIKAAKKGVTKKVFKAYAPMAIFAGLSASCFIGSFHIQKGRELAMATAYTALKDTFDSYRKKVEEKYGAESEKEIMQGDKKVEKVIGHDKDGNAITKVEYEHDKKNNDFLYLFDESNINWTPSASENIYQLATIQNMLNNRLRRRGYLFLYEVYRALGIDPGVLGPRMVQASHVIGWLYDTDNPNGDNYVDFGIFKDDKGNLKDYEYELHVRQGQPSIWLEFNPDGDILTGNNGKRVFTETGKGGSV